MTIEKTLHERPLFIPLKAGWFDAFASGAKNAELRPYGPRWNERTCRPGRAATFSKGYGKRHRLAATVAAFGKYDIHTLIPSEHDAFCSCYGCGIRYVARLTVKINMDNELHLKSGRAADGLGVVKIGSLEIPIIGYVNCTGKPLPGDAGNSAGIRRFTSGQPHPKN